MLFLAINFSFSGLKFLNVPNHAYGLDYEQEPSTYAPGAQYENPDSIYQADFQHMLGVLDNWRKKHSAETIRTGKKPKLVIINASGGGSRSALWSASSLLVADSALNGELMDHCLLITGSSGGMIGAAYLRELKYRNQLGIDPEPTRSEAYNMGRDLLNPVIFSIATNDFFIRYQKFKEGDNVYTKDRAYSFEKQLHSNTDHILNKTLGFYSEPEANAEIPMMVMTPTIVNDGRRLVISSQPMSYLTTNVTPSGEVVEPSSEDVEFARLINDPMSLKFSTALRMNATFPYVLPTVTLPTEPEIDVMDAGLRDNYGMKTTMQFLYTFRNWINTNTSGVVVVQLRDIQKDFQAKSGEPTLVKKFTAPLGSMYGNFHQNAGL